MMQSKTSKKFKKVVFVNLVSKMIQISRISQKSMRRFMKMRKKWMDQFKRNSKHSPIIYRTHLQRNRCKRMVRKKEQRESKVYDMLIYIVFNLLLILSKKGNSQIFNYIISRTNI